MSLNKWEILYCVSLFFSVVVVSLDIYVVIEVEINQNKKRNDLMYEIFISRICYIIDLILICVAYWGMSKLPCKVRTHYFTLGKVSLVLLPLAFISMIAAVVEQTNGGFV